MRSINKVIVIGNLTRDPEMRQTPNGQNVTTFGIATNRDWITKEGERKSSAEFHECVAWAHLAEICSKYLKKGNLVYVEGYLKTRSWDSPEGVKKFKTEVVVQDMIMLEKRKDSEDYIPEEDKEKEKEKEQPATDNKEEKPEEKPKKAKKSTKEKPKEENPEKNPEENPIEKDLGL